MVENNGNKSVKKNTTKTSSFSQSYSQATVMHQLQDPDQRVVESQQKPVLYSFCSYYDTMLCTDHLSAFPNQPQSQHMIHDVEILWDGICSTCPSCRSWCLKIVTVIELSSLCRTNIAVHLDF